MKERKVAAPRATKGRAKRVTSKRLEASDILAINCKKATKNSLKRVKTQWLIPNFLFANSLNMIYGAAGSGKSIFALSVAKHLLESKLIEQVLYIDADNGEMVQKERGLDNILCDGLEYYFAEDLRRFHILDQLLNARSLKNKLIIFDSIRNFVDFDFSKDDKVTIFLHKLQALRSRGATIIFLHHQPKQIDGENNKSYKGATAWLDSVDEGFFLSNNKQVKQVNGKRLGVDEMLFSLEPQKFRVKTLPQAFKVNARKCDFNKVDYLFVGKNHKEQVTLNLALKIITSHSRGITKYDFVKEIQKNANALYYEIVGKNNLWRLLGEYQGKLFGIKTAIRKVGAVKKRVKLFVPLAKADYYTRIMGDEI